jgi:hypothetical protein
MAFSVTLRITIFADVADTVTRDLHRATKVFSSLPIKFTAQRFTLTRGATRTILGTDGKLSIKGGPTAFEHTSPGTQDTVSVSDPDGNFTSEVWAAIRDWTNFGGIRVFYVKEFAERYEGAVVGNAIVVKKTGGITLKAGDVFDPIVFIDQGMNQQVVAATENQFGILEHELGHAFGLDHAGSQGDLMYPNADSRSGNHLSQTELDTVKASPLLKPAS